MKKTLFLAASALALTFATTTTAQEAVGFTLTNNSEVTLLGLLVGESSNDSWGEDLLDDVDMGPGETIEVTIDDELPDCDYDLQAIYDDGDTEEVFEIDLCETDELTIEDDDVDEEEDEDEDEDEE